MRRVIGFGLVGAYRFLASSPDTACQMLFTPFPHSNPHHPMIGVDFCPFPASGAQRAIGTYGQHESRQQGSSQAIHGSAESYASSQHRDYTERGKGDSMFASIFHTATADFLLQPLPCRFNVAASVEPCLDGRALS